MKKKKEKRTDILRANKYPLILTPHQERTIEHWMEQYKWVYNAFIQKKQRYYHLKKNAHPFFEAELKKGWPKKDKTDTTFSHQNYLDTFWRELRDTHPDLENTTKIGGFELEPIPSTAITSRQNGLQSDLKKAYDMLNNEERIAKQNKKKKRNHKRRFHPEEKRKNDDVSIAFSVEKPVIEETGPNSARVYGIPVLAAGRYPDSKIKKSLKIHYPSKHNGKYRIRPSSKILHMRILKENQKFYLVVTYSIPPRPIFDGKDMRPAIGIDLGTDSARSKNFISLSDGTFKSYREFDSCKYMDYLSNKIKKMQRKIRNKKGGNKKIRQRPSKRCQKAYLRIAKLHAKLANTRKYHSKLMATDLVKNHSTIFMENLALSNMVKSAKGTEEKPGKNVKQKAGLNRAIHNVAMYTFKANLINKSVEYGTKIVQINPNDTSRRCFSCGHISKDNRRGTVFSCTSCGHKGHADTNAAKNIELVGSSGFTTIRELK